MLFSSNAAAFRKPHKDRNTPKLPRGPGERSSSFLLKKTHDGDLFVGSVGSGCPFLQVLPFFLWFFPHRQHRLFVCSWWLGLGKVILAIRTGFTLVNLLRHWLREKNKWWWLSLCTKEQRPPHCSLPTAFLEISLLGSRSTSQTQEFSPLLEVMQ